MKKKLLAGLVTGLFLVGMVGLASATVINDFTDGYDVSNWTLSPGSGSIDLTGAPVSVIEISGDAGYGDNTDFTIAALGDGLVTFDWNYTTDDWGPQYDPFGYVINDVFTQVTEDNGSKIQAGTTSFSVSVGDTFGFRARTTDGQWGSSTTTISNFSAPSSVPEPATMFLFGTGLAGLVGIRRRKKQQQL